MHSLRIIPAGAALLAALGAVACGHSSVANETPDGAIGADAEAGASDAFAADAHAAPDAADAGRPDLGNQDPALIMEGNVEIRSLDVHVKLMGTATSTSPPIVFLHMGPGFAHEYLPPLMRFLLPGRLLVFYDLRGEGLTSIGPVGTSTFTAQQEARDLYDLVGWVATINPSPTVDILAHGYGTAVASMFAADHPDRVAHLVFTAPYPADLHQLADFRAESLARLTTGERTLYYQLQDQPQCRGDIVMCSLQLWGLMGPHFLCPENLSSWDDLSFTYANTQNQERIEFYLRRDLYDLRSSLARITAPTTVISGPCDPTPAATVGTYTASISGAIHEVLDHSGYFPMLEQAPEYQTVVRRALRR